MYIQLPQEISICMTHRHLKPKKSQYNGLPVSTICLSPDCSISINGPPFTHLLMSEVQYQGFVQSSAPSPSTLPSLLLLPSYYILIPFAFLHLHCHHSNPETVKCHLWDPILPARLLCLAHSIFINYLN